MPNCRPTRLVVFLAACLACGWAAADEGLSSLDQAFLADARDGALDRFDLPSACLIAGGVRDEVELATERQRLAATCAVIAGQVPAHLTLADRARELVQRMHEQVLVGQYERGASDLRGTLAGGNYNCLSAVVIHHELCDRAGVPLEFWSRPGHVFGKVGNVRIEPTCRQSPVPVIEPATSSRPITPLALVGRFYYNRGVDHLERRQFAPGIAAMRVACQLDPRDGDARANLLAGLNNWAVALSAQDQHAAAAALIARGLAIDPSFAPLVANERYVKFRIAE